RDGKTLVYAATEAGKRMLYVRRLDSAESTPVHGTEGATFPFLSPDGAWVGFATVAQPGELKKVPSAGGTPVVLCSVAPPGRLFGASWTRDGWIVFSDGTQLLRVRDSGGKPETVVAPGEGEKLRAPDVLPGGTHVVFDVFSGNWLPDLAVAPLAGGARKRLLTDAGIPRFSAGHLLYNAADSATPPGGLRLVLVEFAPRAP